MARARPCVLVIDDEEKYAKLIARILERAYDVLPLPSAQEALDRIAAGARFDLILCDVMLPGISGKDFVERLGLLAPGQVQRVVLMTGGAFTPWSEAFVARSGLPRLDKPFGIAELLHLVRQQLEQHGTASLASGESEVKV